MIDLSDYCSPGTGVDCTAAIRAAIAAAGTDGAVQVTTGGTYRVDSRIDATGLRAFISRDDAVFDGRACEDVLPLFVFGARGQNYLSQRTTATIADNDVALAGDAAAGVDRLTVAAGMTVVPGQILLLTTKRYYLATGNADGLWNQITNFYYRGEMAEVLRQDGVKVILRGRLRESYEASKTHVFPLPVHKGVYSDVNVLRDSEEVMGMAVQFCQDSSLVRPICNGARERAVEMVYGWRSRIVSPYVRDAFQTTDGNNYGVALSTCHECDVFNPDVDEAKHAGEEGGYEHCYGCRWVGGTLRSADHGVAGVPAFWTHQNSRGSKLIGVRVDGGIGWTGIDSTAEACVVLGKTNQSPFLIQPSQDAEYYRVQRCASDAGTGQYSWAVALVPGITVGEIAFDGGAHGGGLFGWFINAAHETPWRIRHMKLQNVRWKATTSYTASIAGAVQIDRFDVSRGPVPGGVYLNTEEAPAAGWWPGKADS